MIDIGHNQLSQGRAGARCDPIYYLLVRTSDNDVGGGGHAVSSLMKVHSLLVKCLIGIFATCKEVKET